jgi:hypothetical protein
VHAVACVKDGDRGRTLRSCALWRALVEFYGEGKGGSNPEGEVVEDVVRREDPLCGKSADLSATRTQGTEVTVSLPICACLCCFPEATFSPLLFGSRHVSASVRDRDCASVRVNGANDLGPEQVRSHRH